MECKEVQGQLPAYLEKALAPREESLIEQHLSSCRQCARALLDLKGTGVILKDLDTVEPPPWMTQRIMSRLKEDEEKKKSIFRKLFFPLHVKIPIQASATVVIAVLAIYLLKGVEPEMKATRVPSVPDQTLLREERSEQSTKPEAEPPAPEAKGAESDKEVITRRSDKRKNAVSSEGEQAADRAKEVSPMADAARSAPADALKSAPAEEPVPPRLAKKREAVGSTEEGPARGQQALPQQQPAPPAKRREGRIQKDEAVGGMRAGKALSAAKAARVERTRTDQIRATLHVSDVTAAIKEVEELLNRLGALKVVKESSPNLEVITAEVRTEKIQELIEKLMLIGEVGVSSPSPDSQAEGARIRIEIVNTK